MSDQAWTRAAINLRDDKEKPFELCVGVYQDDTRLAHEDYSLTEDEFKEFQERIERAIIAAKRR